MSGMTENILEETALSWLGDMGYEILHGPDLAPDGVAPERENYGQVVPLKLWTSLRRRAWNARTYRFCPTSSSRK